MAISIQDYNLPPLSKKAVEEIHRRIKQNKRGYRHYSLVVLCPLLEWLEYIEVAGLMTDEIKGELMPLILGTNENNEPIV